MCKGADVSYLKGSNNQWCARYFIEYPSTQSASSFLTPAMKYTMKIYKRQCKLSIICNKLLDYDLQPSTDVSGEIEINHLSSEYSVVPQRYVNIPLPGVSESI